MEQLKVVCMDGERELKLFTKAFKAIADILPLDIWIEDDKGIFLFVNKYVKGHSANDYLPINNSISDNDIALHFDIQTVKSLRFGEAAHYTERTGIGAYEIYRIPLLDRNGIVRGYLGYTKDITHEVLLYNFPGMAYRSKNNEDYTMTFISNGCYELTGYRPDELINTALTYYDLIQQPYRGELLEEWKTDLEEYQIESKEYPITTAGGKTKWVWELYQEWRNTHSEYVATEGFITDITERKTAKEALTKSEERFRTIYEKAPLGIGIFNTDTGMPIQINKRFTEILGRSEADLMGMSWNEYAHPGEIEEYIENLQKLASEEIAEFSMDKRCIKPEGTVVWVNMTVVPFYSIEIKGKSHMCMIEDITFRKTVEEKNRYLSIHDPLTGLFNRRYYESALKQIDKIENLPISVVVADVNDLKYINDTFGHLEGDRLLIEVAEVLAAECRNCDVIARIGGDEFVILISKTDNAEVEALLEQLKAKIETLDINGIPTSVAFGAATKEEEEKNIKSVFIDAENRMYNNKTSKV